MTESPEERSLAGLSYDFWAFWSGQAISTLGSSFTTFALPLLIFQLTGSAVNLSLSMAVSYLPSLLFGLIIGAWVDRMDRKRVMMAINLLLGASVASVPLMAASGHLTVWWIYGMQFAASTFRLFFTSAAFAAVPSLVPRDQLVAANGRIQASYSAMSVIGPALAGALVALVPLSSLLLVDAGSYLVATGALLLVRRSFNAGAQRPQSAQTLRADIREGLSFLFGHPVLRNISIMMAMVNFVSMTVAAQLVFFAKVQLHASNTQIGLLFSANAVAILLLSLSAGPLRRHWPFSRVALGLLEIQGFVTIVMAHMHVFWAVLPLIALWQGLGALFSINTTSLRQSVTPQHLLGRVVATANVLGGAVIPFGTLAGGFAIERTGNIGLVFTVIGVLVFLLPFVFSFTALGHAERYVPTHGVRHAPVQTESRALELWVEQVARRCDPENAGPELAGDRLDDLRLALERMRQSAQAITGILDAMVTQEPGPGTLRQTVSELEPPVEALAAQWRDLRAHVPGNKAASPEVAAQSREHS